MFIQEIILEGFKSYAQKTVVSGFDPQFNAITGLNGTGKSNILDSICFLLGITNLSQVRVGNLQELVYKQGQAGVNKATVTIVFNNADPAQSPVGYESHKQITITRQIVIGGKNKYMINGHTVQQSQVQNLFHSVQLNVNNPHFLIMQGRITKVLNMKPPEILSMIQEASGTRMFETKKEAALKTIEKKQLKVEELSKCMNEDIIPTLENLRGERQNYLQWQSNNSELERLERFCIAGEYKLAAEKLSSSEDDKQKLLNDIQSMENEKAAKESEAELCSNKIIEIEKQRDNEMEGEFQLLKKREGDLSKDLVKLNTLLTNQKESFSNDKENLLNLQKNLESLNQTLVTKNQELVNLNNEYKQKELECTGLENEAISLREKYQNACAGVTDEADSELLSIPEQVAAWEKKQRESQSQLKQIELKVTHGNNKLKELQNSLKSHKIAYDNASKEATVLSNKVETLFKKFSSFKSDDKLEAQYRNRGNDLKLSINKLTDQIDKLQANIDAKLNFDFMNPEARFDRNRVKGLVAKLVHVKDRNTSTALEIAAGNKLYQVVVDNETTGKLLLQKGQLKKRVTIIPLNKINSKCVDSAKMAKAKSIASSLNGTANLAIELIGYDDEVQKAMEYCFGNVIICNSSEVAKAIAFDKNIRNRTVTLDGDSYDPAGTLTGGSKNQIGVLLSKMDELSSMYETLSNQQKELKDLNSLIDKIEVNENNAKDAKNEWEISKQQLQLCHEKLSSTTYAQIQLEIDEMNTQLDSHHKEVFNLKDLLKKSIEELNKLKNSEKNAKKSREKVLKEMEGLMKQASKEYSNMKSLVSSLRGKKEALVSEMKGMESEIKQLQEQIINSEIALTNLSSEIEKLTSDLIVCKESYESSKTQVASKQKELNACSKEIKSLSTLQDRCLKASQDISLEIRKLQHNLKQWEKDFKDAGKVVSTLIKQHPWIENEKEYFGVSGSDFDFQGKDIHESMSRLKKLKSEQEKLSKKINKKVMGMIEKAEAEYEDLRRKKEVILNDKAKIEAVIDELDVKKSQALQTTWVKVNRDFGSIFSMLLPGTHAKLEPPEGQTVNDGLEVKVAFNGVWKDSLTELSGGQRSLLALSLILSLLLFKPAPMYILDEVDAALDLSHTQNIGLMLRTHFSKSQFIVVSLKEGMFNNANVIFRTKFVDGISAVTRTVVNGRSNVKEIQNGNIGDEENEDVQQPQKKKGKAISNALKKSNASVEV